jgi:hypothetical protein
LPEKSIAHKIQSERSLPEKSKPEFGRRIRAMAPRKTRYFLVIWKNWVFWGGDGTALRPDLMGNENKKSEIGEIFHSQIFQVIMAKPL